MEHNIVISEDQNTVTVDGRVFIAEENGKITCTGCMIISGICCEIPCSVKTSYVARKDGKEVIFKEQLKTE